mgnify:CR=1 FL=1
MHNTYPTMGTHIQVGAIYTYAPNERWELSGGLFSAKYTMPSFQHGARNDFGFSGSAAYRINKFLRIRVEITYLCGKSTFTKMKKLILFLSLILSVGFASAQSEIPSDSIRRAPSTNIKEFGGFLLDMGLMNVATPELPKFNLDMPNTPGLPVLDTDMVGDCLLLHSLCRWDLSN